MALLREKIVHFVDALTRPSVVGMDISDRAVKFFKFGKRGGKFFVDACGEIPLLEGVITKGEIQRPETLTDALRRWWKNAPRSIRASLAVASLPEEKSFLRVIQLPKIQRNEIVKAIRWEIEENIPLPIAELTYDYEVIETPDVGQDHFDVVIVAFSRTIVEAYLKAFQQSGIQLAALELESQATVRALTVEPRDVETRIIVEIGRTRSNIIVCAAGVITFTTTVEIGGKIFEENIQRSLGVDAARAIEIKKTNGLDKRRSNIEVFGAIVPALGALKDELDRTITYWQEHTTHLHGIHPAVSEIILAGGDANLFGLDTYLASALKLPVRYGDPFVAVRGSLEGVLPPISKRKALEFTSAIGHALRGIR